MPHQSYALAMPVLAARAEPLEMLSANLSLAAWNGELRTAQREMGAETLRNELDCKPNILRLQHVRGGMPMLHHCNSVWHDDTILSNQ